MTTRRLKVRAGNKLTADDRVATDPLRQVMPVAILRPDVLQEVERFIRVNQPPAALSAHAG